MEQAEKERPETELHEKPASQLFRKMVSRDAWMQLLRSVAALVEEDAWLVIDKDAFRRGMYHGIIPTFLETELAPCYHVAQRRKYLDSREMCYATFLTIVRQLCRMHSLPFTTHKRYDRSKPLAFLKVCLEVSPENQKDDIEES